MAINKILYVDDSFENGMTAMTADPRIDFASGIQLIERPLQDYDCIITDMQMEHAESGMELVERALREGKLPWVATGGTYEHGGTFDRVRVFNSDLLKVFDKVAKNEPRFWRDVLTYIEQNQNNPTIIALEKVRATLGIVPEDSIRTIMQLYQHTIKAKNN